MIRTLWLITLPLVVAPAALTAQDAQRCQDQARTQMEMNQCAAAELVRADSVLNRTYAQVVAGMDASRVPLLRQAQRAWIDIRDSECALDNADFEGGSIHPMLQATCAARQTRTRTAYLRGLLLAREPEYVDPRSVIIMATDALFQAMQDSDTTTLRQLIHPRAQVVAVSENAVSVRTADEWIRAVPRNPGVLTERMWDPRVKVDGNLATLWAPYDVYLGDRFSHCGHDAFQFVREGGAWKMIAITFTRRTAGCPETP